MKKIIICFIFLLFHSLCFCQINDVEYYPKQSGWFKVQKIKKTKNVLQIYAERVDSLVPLDSLQYPNGRKGDRVKIVSQRYKGKRMGEKIRRNKSYYLTLQSLYVRRINNMYELPPWDAIHIGCYYNGVPIELEPENYIVNIFEAEQIKGGYYVK